jgi:hypothetical protein
MNDEPDEPEPEMQGRLPRSLRPVAWVLWFVVCLIPAAPIVVYSVVFLGPFVDPRIYPYTRFPKFLICWLLTVVVVRYALPTAWHYRRDDKTGLAFVLIFIGILVWNGLMLLTGTDLK